MNKREYLQKKGEIPPDLGVLHVVNSTRAGVTLTEEPIWDVKPVKTTRFVDDQSVVVEGKKYSLQHKRKWLFSVFQNRRSKLCYVSA
jgi:hypothetical protein